MKGHYSTKKRVGSLKLSRHLPTALGVAALLTFLVLKIGFLISSGATYPWKTKAAHKLLLIDKTHQYLLFQHQVVWHIIFTEKENQNHCHPPFHLKVIIFRTSSSANYSPNFMFSFLSIIEPWDNSLIYSVQHRFSTHMAYPIETIYSPRMYF